MIALPMIVDHEFRDSTTQRGLPDEDHLFQAFLLDRADEAVLSRYCAGSLNSRFTIETQHPTEPLTPLYFCPRHRQRGSGLDYSNRFSMP